MPALSKSTIVEQIFDALPLVEGFKYSKEELELFLSQSSFKISTNSKSSPDPNRKVSVYNCYLNANSQLTIKERREQWKVLSSDTDSNEYLQYQQIADDINSSKNIPSKLSKEDKKTLKAQKTKDEKTALQLELKKAKELYNNSTSSGSSHESEHESEPESEHESEPESEHESEHESALESEHESEHESAPESAPESEPETISDDDNSDFDKQLQQIKNEEEQQDNEKIDELSDDSGIDSEDDNEQNTSIKPQYTGKKPDSSTNNYKEWKKNQMNIPTDKSLSRFDYEKGKEEDNFNSKIYDDSVQWFEYITNNMTIINS
jgi:hypothetical protein